MKDPEKIAAWKDEKADRIKAEGERLKTEIMGEADRLKEKYEDELKKNKEEIELLLAEIPGGEKMQKMVMDALEGRDAFEVNPNAGLKIISPLTPPVSSHSSFSPPMPDRTSLYTARTPRCRASRRFECMD